MAGREMIWLRRTGALTMVAEWCATPTERGRALPPHEAHAVLADLAGGAARASVVALYELATGVDAHNARGIATTAMLARIGAAVARGTLLLVGRSMAGGMQPASSAAPGQTVTADDRLVEAIMARRPAISFGGRRYRVVTAPRWLARPANEARGRSETELVAVPAPEARVVLRRMIEWQQTPAAERQRWKTVLDRLWDEGEDDGIVLVGTVPTGGMSAPKTDEPPVPPSQLRPKVAETTWIELEIVYEDGTPFEGACTIEIPGGRTINGPPDADGVLRLDKIDPGSCKVSFPDFQQDAN